MALKVPEVAVGRWIVPSFSLVPGEAVEFIVPIGWDRGRTDVFLDIVESYATKAGASLYCLMREHRLCFRKRGIVDILWRRTAAEAVSGAFGCSEEVAHELCTASDVVPSAKAGELSHFEKKMIETAWALRSDVSILDDGDIGGRRDRPFFEFLKKQLRERESATLLNRTKTGVLEGGKWRVRVQDDFWFERQVRPVVDPSSVYPEPGPCWPRKT